ncbi:adenylate/guanylate cyclase domain-containing protein [Hoeflea prorocentri]|uniref:Adenylate/guanylate cyclase domain-containing protein n=1 Tax=Hoeflea prorocentri TaxID=1922333 RepID=A0A9X3UM48_9HYPH|nr:adenylate/guanylate cyclase domain-containing protein [Hoeflea prorocentri]MCY6381606.1 adenylate/guanylate cyclase domain-containing protein [Hoeflea prorocentri]MDA5399406.1 adenylate/guanylate cyclase domain-containing protein [Hoeflea prorocentri]
MNSESRSTGSEYGRCASGQRRLQLAEDTGLRIAIFCRSIAAAAGFIWYSSSVFLTDQELRGWPLFAFAIYILISIAHLSVIGTRANRWWMKYVLYTFDILAVCALFVTIPISSAEDIPQIIAFRAYGIYYLFPVIALAALSLSWRLVLWSGLVAVAGWWAAFLWVVAGMDNTLSWADMPADATRTDYETIFLSIDFIGRGNRLEESGLLLVAAATLSVAVYRARRLFFAQIEADEKRQKERLERQRITDTFGQYVPEVVVKQLVNAKGKLPYRQAHGAVLVLDIEGFSKRLAGGAPEVAIRQIDAFLSDAADEIGKHNGTVISYTGDGILASFNAPLENARPELAAAETAFALIETARAHHFNIRIGLAAGELTSGSVGSKNRMAFTVYGAAVNRAARCEALCKEMKLKVLMDAKFALAVSDQMDVRSIGSHDLRGISKSEPLSTFGALS